MAGLCHPLLKLIINQSLTSPGVVLELQGNEYEQEANNVCSCKVHYVVEGVVVLLLVVDAVEGQDDDDHQVEKYLNT